MDDLQALKDKWLGICGACDAGIGGCSHPDGDYRPVMLKLVREVERLRTERDEFRDSALMYAAQVADLKAATNG